MLKKTIAILTAIVSAFATTQAVSAQPAPASASAAYSPVPTLNKLHAFDKRYGGENYCDGFAVGKFDDDSGLGAGWSKDSAFLKQLYPFARATGSGSFYAIWQMKPGDDLSKSPIVVFGDEGGEHVVAQEMDDFLRVLAFDVEPSIDHDKVYFFKPDDHQPSDEHRAYKRWLKDNFGVATTPHPDKIVKDAQAKFGAAFAKWKKRFVPE
jgi:hypothetical protein